MTLFIWILGLGDTSIFLGRAPYMFQFSSSASLYMSKIGAVSRVFVTYVGHLGTSVDIQEHM